MEDTRRKLSPKEAVTAAFEYFQDLYPQKQFMHLLLEGIKYNPRGNLWEVTIGFDLGREYKVSNQLEFAGKKIEPIREFRVIRLEDGNGEFMELTHA